MQTFTVEDHTGNDKKIRGVVDRDWPRVDLGARLERDPELGLIIAVRGLPTDNLVPTNYNPSTGQVHLYVHADAIAEVGFPYGSYNLIPVSSNVREVDVHILN